MAERRAGGIERSGSGIGEIDVWIAGHQSVQSNTVEHDRHEDPMPLLGGPIVHRLAEPSHQTPSPRLLGGIEPGPIRQLVAFLGFHRTGRMVPEVAPDLRGALVHGELVPLCGEPELISAWTRPTPPREGSRVPSSPTAG